MKKLQRTLSLPGAIAVSIGGMLSGIFVLPGLAVGITGSSVWLAFLVAALCILPAVLSKSELATAMPKSERKSQNHSSNSTKSVNSNFNFSHLF